MAAGEASQGASGPAAAFHQARLQLECRGVVQGVGFRPAVHRLARQLGLGGSLHNAPGLVRLTLTGERHALERFLAELPGALPPGARLEPLVPCWLAEVGVAPGADADRPGSDPGHSAWPAGVPAAAGEACDAADRRTSTAHALAAPHGAGRACRATAAAAGSTHAPDAAAPTAPTLTISAEPEEAASPLAIGLIAPSLAADRAPCAACLRELEDPRSRRCGDPFLACCTCGPRYTIATAEPWRRAHTTLAAFPPCSACAAEFADPRDRRFHSETISCPACGPRLALLAAPAGAVDAPIASATPPPRTPEAQPPFASPEAGLERPAPERASPRRTSGAQAPPPAGLSATAHHRALIEAAATLLEQGKILALQGVGGFQLLVDASNRAAVARLRRRKRRPARPFALLVADPAWIAPHVRLDPAALALLQAPAAPIVLLPRRLEAGGSPSGSATGPHSSRAQSGEAGRSESPLPATQGALSHHPGHGHPPAPQGPSSHKGRGVHPPEAEPGAPRPADSPDADPLDLPPGDRWPDPFPGVAPGSGQLGVMLPASPLHRLLMRRFGRPLVCTSGNRSGEPLCSDPAEALERLAGIADAFLLHDRPIARPLDDSVAQLIEGRPALLRRARGYAPEPLELPPGTGPGPSPGPAAGPGVSRITPSSPGGVGGAEGLERQPAVLALGGDLKAAPALALAGRVWLAPHLGDLSERRGFERYRAGIAELLQRYGDQLERIAIDRHPGYLTHQIGVAMAQPPLALQAVQHHAAHALAVVAEHGLQPPLLAFCADGLGYGEEDDRAREPSSSRPAPLWGGELLAIGPDRIERLAGLRPLPLPGGDRAAREPRRVALGLLAAAGPGLLEHPGARRCRRAFRAAEQEQLVAMVERGVNCPWSSSLGRLFDGVASLLGVCQRQSHEGEAALRLQGLAALAAAVSPPQPDGRGDQGFRHHQAGPASPPDGEPRPENRSGPLASAPGTPGPDAAPLQAAHSHPIKRTPARHPEAPPTPEGGYPFPQVPAAAGQGSPLPLGWLDWQPLVVALQADRAAGVAASRCALRFHQAVAGGVADLLATAAGVSGCRTVVLAGGCFQNALLLEDLIARLRQRGLEPHMARAVPGNDGGLALGQVWACRRPAVRE